MSSKPSETISLEALRNGDRAEFARTVEADYAMIYRLSIKMVGNPQDAEEILQETLIKAHRHIKDFDGWSSPIDLARSRCHQRGATFLRRKRPEQISIDEPVETEEGEVEPVQIVDWCCLPEQELLSSEARQHLDRVIEELSPSLRVVFVLRGYPGAFHPGNG